MTDTTNETTTVAQPEQQHSQQYIAYVPAPPQQINPKFIASSLLVGGCTALTIASAFVGMYGYSNGNNEESAIGAAAFTVSTVGTCLSLLSFICTKPRKDIRQNIDEEAQILNTRAQALNTNSASL